MLNISHQKGFSLLELIIALSIIAILITISYPSYTHYLVTARRYHALLILKQLAQQLASFYQEHHSYLGAPIEKMVPAETQLYYRFTFSDLQAENYTIEAAPKGQQAKHDLLCGKLTLNHLGVINSHGTGITKQCWR